MKTNWIRRRSTGKPAVSLIAAFVLLGIFIGLSAAFLSACETPEPPEESMTSLDSAESLSSADSAESLSSEDSTGSQPSEDSAESLPPEDSTESLPSEESADNPSSKDPAESHPSEDPAESQPGDDPNRITLTEQQIRDKTEGSWAAQMIGVAWGASTEFHYCGQIIPANEVPEWKPEMINDAFSQDDLYVEIPFLDAMAAKGPDCSLTVLAEAFRDTSFPLCHANYLGRRNLREGLSAPDSGNYRYNYHADDIDWQIEADFLGNLFPGLVDAAAEKAFEIGHIMNYGDGVYGGVYIAAMHAAAFTAKTVKEVADAGRTAIPKNTKFRSVLDEVDACFRDGNTWEQCWKKIQDKWASGAKCAEYRGLTANIDAKLNAAYIHIGLLWGNGDFAETIRISMRCGQDSDCNPSSAAGVLGTLYGLSGLPAEYVSALNRDGVKFINTDYTFKDCIDASVKIAKKALKEYAKAGSDSVWNVPEQTSAKDDENGLVPVEQWPSDSLTAYLSAVVMQGGKVRLDSAYVLPDGYTGEVTHSFDMGDGTVLPFMAGSYEYLADGTYEIKYTVKAGGKKSTAKATVTVAGSGDRGFKAEPDCSTRNPIGGGSKDLQTIVDGIIPDPAAGTQFDQFDTYNGASSTLEWFAIKFDHSVQVTGVRFSEGMHFWDGGWFDSEPTVQILQNGKWKDAESSCSPPYGQGSPFGTFTFTLKKAAWCDGVRVAGRPGGSGKFASCSELDVLFSDVKDPTPGEPDPDTDPVADAILIVSVANPRGTGCKDLEIIRDGHVPSAQENYQLVSYDTFDYNATDHEEYVGYLFRKECRVSSVTFTEGAHFSDGGYFKDGSIRLEVLQNGDWVSMNVRPDPAYPVGNTQGAFGSNYENYTFRLSSPVGCQGIRVIGAAGGTMHFISVSELSVEFAD